MYKNKNIGAFGDVAAFSTMYSKNHATGGCGGVVYTTNEELFWKIRSYADRGKPFTRKCEHCGKPVPTGMHWFCSSECALSNGNHSRMDVGDGGEDFSPYRILDPVVRKRMRFTLDKGYQISTIK